MSLSRLRTGMAAQKPENSSLRTAPVAARSRAESILIEFHEDTRQFAASDSQPTATAPPPYPISTMQVSPRFAVLFMMLLAGSVGAGDVPSTDSPTQAPAGVQLPMNTAPFEGKSCTPVKIEGDATYCIEGRVCSSGSFPGSYCPKSGDVALSNCWTSHPSYNLASNSCVAYADAECKPINGSEILGCVFPSIAAAPAPAQTANESPLDVGANTLTNAASAPSTAQTSMMATTFSASNDSNNGNSQGNSGKGLGAFASAAIAVAVVVVAVAAVAVMKRSRDERQHQDTSSRALSCVELSTPV